MNYHTETVSTQFSLLQTGLQRYSITLRQKQPAQQQMLRMHTSTRFGAFTDSLNILLPTVVLNLPAISPKSLTTSLKSTYTSLLPTTFRRMDSPNVQYRYASSISASTAMIGKTTSEHGYLSPNLPMIPHLPPHMVTLAT